MNLMMLLGFNVLDMAILYGHYDTAYFLMQKTHLKPQ